MGDLPKVVFCNSTDCTYSKCPAQDIEFDTKISVKVRLFRRSLPANAQNHPNEINFVLLIYPFGYNIVAEMRQMIATGTDKVS